jgi:tetratricopeptide (TPR) repeat protein
MRKNSSKTLKGPKKLPTKASYQSKSTASKKASSGSGTAFGSASKRRRTHGWNSDAAKEAELHSDPQLNQMLEEAIRLKNERDFSGAVKILRMAVRLYPKCSPAHGLLGGIYFSFLNRPAAALPHCKKAAKLAPKSEMASLALFHSLWELDRQVEALEEMKRFQTISHSRDYDEILAEIKTKSRA